MKNTEHIYLLTATFLSLFSCTKETQVRDSIQPSDQVITFEAVMTDSDDASKTVIQNETAVYWSPKDSIKVFYGTRTSGKFVSESNEAVTKASFVGTFDRLDASINAGAECSDYWGVYPYSQSATCNGNAVTVTVSPVQTAMEGTFAPDLFPAIAKSPSLSLAFYNVCGGVMFTVSQDGITSVTFKGNNNENIAGSAYVGVDSEGKPQVESFISPSPQITVTAPGGGSFKPGVKYYIVAYPANLSAGWSITYKKAASQGIYSNSSPTTIKRSTFGKVENKDKDVSFEPIPTSLGGANCFVISSYGPSSFDCSKKGNSTESVGDIACAKVLWESFGTGTTPNVGDVISDVSYSDGKVSFTANADGNAVIAVKDASDNILWSWHIWICKDFDPVATAQVYNNNAGTMMDRNLGAISATPGAAGSCGLLYQWGRKDPFLGGSCGSASANSTITWPDAVTSDANNGTVAYAVTHPTTFIACNENNYDWYYTGSSSIDNTRWQTSDKGKGMYDPCPTGWRVPDGGKNGVWSKAFGSNSYYNNGPWNDTSKGMDFGSSNGHSEDHQLGSSTTIWYPAAGYYGEKWAVLFYAGNDGLYWSCTPLGYTACCFHFTFSQGGYVYPTFTTYLSRSSCRSVRCIKEGSTPSPEPTYVDLSLTATSNCYIVSESGSYKFNATVKGCSTETLDGTPITAEILWESFGTDVSPAAGDIVCSVSYSDGYVQFTTPSTLKDGNAVIAVKDASGTILWSWHIWICKDFDPVATAQVYNNNAGTMMDRNLGAISATPGAAGSCGLLYQWGRKDPFLGGSCGYDSAASTLSWPGTVSSSSSTGTNAYAVAHPTTFITYNSNNYDWYYTGSSSTDNTRWQTSDKDKGMYDPCPAGWRVPDGGSSGVWSTAFGSSSSYSSGLWDDTNRGMNFGSGNGKSSSMQLGSASTIWYSAAGYRKSGDGTLINVGNYGTYWSCTPYDNSAYYMYVRSNGGVFPSNGIIRAYGRSVRCLSESK